MSQSGAERRQWARIPAEALTHITASVVAGPKVRLVNLSRGGALMEVASRFPMRSRVRLKLTRDSGEVAVAEGVVAWARVAAIVDKQVNYLVAVIFDKTIPDLGGMDVQPTQEGAAQPSEEEAPAPLVAPVRDNLTQFPTPAARAPEPVPAVREWNDSGEHVVSLDDDEEQTAEAVRQSADHVAALSASNSSLSTQLTAAAAECQTLRHDLETARRGRDEERARLLQELAAAASNMEVLQETLAAREHEQTQAELARREQDHQNAATALDEQRTRFEALQEALASREQEHAHAVAALAEQQQRVAELQSTFAAQEEARVRTITEFAALQHQLTELQSSVSRREHEHLQALAEQKAGYEALTNELVQASNDQQAEHQLLMDERTAWREEQRRRDETHALEMARVREEATQEREQLELHYLELQARFDASQSHCATLEARDRNLRTDLDKVMSTLSALVTSTRSDQNPGRVSDRHAGNQAVA